MKVCTANAARRFTCDSSCAACGFLMTDRRQRQVNSYLPYFSDRRQLNTWIPYSYRIAGMDQTADLPPRRETLWTLPLFLMGVLMLFNLLDALLTARALSLGVAEGNPVMAGIFQTSVPVGMALKAGLVAAGAFGLWWYRHLPIAVRGMLALTICYSAVVVYHVVFQFLV